MNTFNLHTPLQGTRRNLLEQLIFHQNKFVKFPSWSAKSAFYGSFVLADWDSTANPIEQPPIVYVQPS
jgi:hypothetical protein